MFEDLDDPHAFQPDDEFRHGVIRRAVRRRRRRRLSSAAVAMTVVLLGGIGGALAFFDHRMDQIDRVDVRTALTTDPPKATDDQVDAPFTLLVVGTDTGDPLGGTGERIGVSGLRSDTMVLVRVDPARRRLTTLSLPRDLYLPIAGTGASNRLNSVDSAAQLITTIRRQLGVSVQHYLQVDFRGAIRMVDAVGGLRLRFATPARDRNSGLDVDAGCQRLDGRSTLAFGRSRHYEVLVDGRWRDDTTSDIGRMRRAQITGDALIETLRRLSATDPLAIARVVDVLADHATVDSGLSNTDLIRLARQLRVASSQHLELPLHRAFAPAPEGGADVLELSAGAAAVVRAFQAGETEPGAPAGSPFQAPADVPNPQPC